MNEDRIKGKWTQMKGKIREAWGTLTEDELDKVQGRHEQLVGLIQERYGLVRDDVDHRVREIEKSIER